MHPMYSVYICIYYQKLYMHYIYIYNNVYIIFDNCSIDSFVGLHHGNRISEQNPDNIQQKHW